MIKMEQISDFSRRLAREFNPKKVILFGSYAYGRPNADSDVDLLVIMPCKGNPVHKSVEITMKLRPEFPTDLLVKTPAKIRQRLAMGDDFIADIINKGKVLYEASNR